MQRVVLDTCVLFPNYLRDTLLRLAEVELYEPLWSTDILDELTRNVGERIGALKAKGIVEAMAGTFPDSLVSGYEALIPAMANDPKDRHVLAAAVRGQAHAVVTLNVTDFPAEASDPYEIEVMRPDDFLLDMLDLAPVEMNSVLRAQVGSYRREPRDLHGLLDRLDAGGVPQFAAEFRRRL
ncbi:PIN domain-containing protein [Streptomyces atratus]|uniref:PIN domain-containing protein n=1 Tax=Streptomyces atratus TaxID=1893 RepID=UPI0016708DF2|nr:PIN domain-containing protein [Streptomyces atratus]WPW30309.1 PIN domain-containing protein [Streptomyces atratus]GGT46284.1 PIN domain-containing protein [Streptomyces atratus]